MKKLFLSALSLAVVAVLCSCGGKPKTHSVAQTGLVTIPLEASIEEERKVALSDLAEKVEYIPLETDTNCLVGNLWDNRIIRSKQYFFLAMGKSLLQYSLNGKFVRNIGSVGQGPGEYSWITDIDVRDDSRQLFVSTDEKINVYDIETGKFLHSLPAGYRDFQFKMLNDTTAFRFLYNSNGQVKNRVLITDNHGDTLRAYPRYDLFTVKEGMAYMIGSSNDRFMYRCGSDICYRENYNDTIFTVTEEALIPRYLVDLGKYHLPLEYRFEVLGDNKKFAELATPYLAIHPIETADYLFIPYEAWAGDNSVKGQLAIYDKRSGECYTVADRTLKDDFNHLFDFIPTVALDDHTLLKVFTAEAIFKLAEKEPSILEHEALKGLQEDDNPVLMVVTLK